MIFYKFCQICVVKSICQHYSESTHSGMTMTSHACMCGGAHDVSLERELPNMLRNTSMRWMCMWCFPYRVHVHSSSSCVFPCFLLNYSIFDKFEYLYENSCSSINETIKLKYNTRRSIVFISNMNIGNIRHNNIHNISYLT